MDTQSATKNLAAVTGHNPFEASGLPVRPDGPENSTIRSLEGLQLEPYKPGRALGGT